MNEFSLEGSISDEDFMFHVIEVIREKSNHKKKKLRLKTGKEKKGPGSIWEKCKDKSNTCGK